MNNTFKDITLPITTENPLFGKILYPRAKELKILQSEQFWTDEEIKVEKDVNDFRNVMTNEQLDIVRWTLASFVEAEVKIGKIWETIAEMFPHSEVQGMCNIISAMENSIHAFFYQKMSDELNITPEEVANEQESIKSIKDKLDFMRTIAEDIKGTPPIGLATVAMIEQVLLFSNFAMLMSFGANGNNLMPTTLSGVKYVISDEILHFEAAKYLYNTYKSEYNEKYGEFPQEVLNKIMSRLKKVVENEDAMIDYMLKDKVINGITAKDVKMFIRDRANTLLHDLGFKKVYKVKENKIGAWFYPMINAVELHDFFVAVTNQYSRNWSEEGFSLLQFLRK